MLEWGNFDGDETVETEQALLCPWAETQTLTSVSCDE